MKNLIGIVFLLSVNLFYAQDFTGKATYKTFRKITINSKDIKGNMDVASQKKMQERLNKKMQKMYTLNFSKLNSTYIQNKEITPEVNYDNKVSIIGNGGVDVFYKDVSKRSYTNKKELFGKVFLIKDSLPMLAWQMNNETKQIGKYICYKAIKSEEKERLTFIMVDGKNEPHTEKVNVVTTAWYAPEIPVNNGPDYYWGLPGLILEINEGKKTILCTELVENPSKKISIEVPGKGKKVNQKEFDVILKRKEKEIMERFKMNQKGGGINIQTQ